MLKGKLWLSGRTAGGSCCCQSARITPRSFHTPTLSSLIITHKKSQRIRDPSKDGCTSRIRVSGLSNNRISEPGKAQAESSQVPKYLILYFLFSVAPALPAYGNWKPLSCRHKLSNTNIWAFSEAAFVECTDTQVFFIQDSCVTGTGPFSQ